MVNFKSGGNVNGTCLQGYVTAHYEDLVAVFGQPKYGPHADMDGKVTCEWVITFTEDGEKVVATIYDWKMGDTPIGREYDWHIGGFTNRAVQLVNQVFTDYQHMVYQQLELQNYAERAYDQDAIRYGE